MNQAYVENTLWILTDEKLYTSDVNRPDHFCCCCYPPSETEHGSVALSQIFEFKDNFTGGECTLPCCKEPKVFATLEPGHRVANLGRVDRPDHCYFIVQPDGKEQALALLRSTKQAADARATMMAVPMATQAPVMPMPMVQVVPMQAGPQQTIPMVEVELQPVPMAMERQAPPG